MDGPSSDVVGSANASYVPQPQYGGNGSTKAGVWCSSSVTTPVDCNSRDKSNWLYPQPAADFNQVSTSLCNMKKVAFANDAATAALAAMGTACSQVPATRTNAYLPRRASSFSNTKGYLIQLNTDGTYNLSYVNGENDRSRPYTSALTLVSVANNIAMPSSGVIFAEDNVWVRTNPTYHGRVSIAAGRLADTNSADINIVDNMLYSTKNGQDVIGLVAENDVLVAPYAPPASGAFNFEIDAAALAQSGSVTWPEFYKTSSSRCTPGWVNTNQTFTFYGSVATRQYWTWNYSKGNCADDVYDAVSGSYISGIQHTATNYDYSLLYAPPPSYPITGGFNILSWREVLTKP